MLDRMKLIDAKRNPFYQHSEMQLFLAERDGKAVGRIAAITNKAHNDEHGDQAGFFGFFECIDDSIVAKSLFAEAESWLRKHGVTSILGPANPSVNDEYGLLVRGFDRPPVMLMTYNPPYYERLILENGYSSVKDLYAWLLSQKSSRTEKLERVVKAMRDRHKIAVRAIDTHRFNEDVATIKRIYNAAWEKNWGFVPMTDAEIDFLAADLKQVYDPNLVLFAEIGGEIAGFALSIPDINQSFHAGPKIPSGILNLPVGVFNMLTKKKVIDTVRVITLGVLKEFRGRGVDALLYWETMERAKRAGYAFGEASWVLEDNEPMNRAAQMMNGENYKTYRIFEKQL